MKMADWISEFSGSLPFLFIHCVLFALWIVLNTGPLERTSLGGWDPFPYGFLTMCVSLEAIILSVFVLLSQNRQVARDRTRNDIEYQVNLKAELEIAHLHEKIDEMNAELLERLKKLERHARPLTARSAARPVAARGYRRYFARPMFCDLIAASTKPAIFEAPAALVWVMSRAERVVLLPGRSGRSGCTRWS